MGHGDGRPPRAQEAGHPRGDPRDGAAAVRRARLRRGHRRRGRPGGRRGREDGLQPLRHQGGPRLPARAPAAGRAGRGHPRPPARGLRRNPVPRLDGAVPRPHRRGRERAGPRDGGPAGARQRGAAQPSAAGLGGGGGVPDADHRAGRRRGPGVADPGHHGAHPGLGAPRDLPRRARAPDRRRRPADDRRRPAHPRARRLRPAGGRPRGLRRDRNPRPRVGVDAEVPRVPRPLLAVLLALGLTAPGAACAQTPPAGAPPAAHPVTVSLEFDDGMLQGDVAPLLARHGLRATFFVNSAFVGRPGYLTWDDLRTRAARGNEVAGHTRTHADLTTLSAAAQRREICGDRAALMAHGLRPISFASPYGPSPAQPKRIVRSCGYTSARRASGLRAPRYAVNRLHLTDRFAIPTLPAPVDTTTAQDVERQVLDAERHGGGWVQIFWHRLCDDDCFHYSWPAQRLDEVLGWLRAQADAGAVHVLTVRDALREGR